MIHVKIKVKNDHRSMTEDFEAETLILSSESEELLEWVEKVIKDFGDPVEEVIVKTKMEM